mmetsp:Transcript_1441/g.3155  ORF Transcript_1441/g.3155 Transcript_1441/m.3155 type:complete len:191 (-) Transcript_1441:85-657(-)
MHILKDSSIKSALKGIRFEGLRALSLYQQFVIPSNLHELFPSLTTLCLSHCTHIDQETISKNAPLLQQIEQLVLCDTDLQDEDFLEMIRCCLDLRSLVLLVCQNTQVKTILQALWSSGGRIKDCFFLGDKASMDRCLQSKEYSSLSTRLVVRASHSLLPDGASFHITGGEEAFSRWIADNFVVYQASDSD